MVYLTPEEKFPESPTVQKASEKKSLDATVDSLIEKYGLVTKELSWLEKYSNAVTKNWVPIKKVGDNYLFADVHDISIKLGIDEAKVRKIFEGCKDTKDPTTGIRRELLFQEITTLLSEKNITQLEPLITGYGEEQSEIDFVAHNALLHLQQDPQKSSISSFAENYFNVRIRQNIRQEYSQNLVTLLESRNTLGVQTLIKAAKSKDVDPKLLLEETLKFYELSENKDPVVERLLQNLVKWSESLVPLIENTDRVLRILETTAFAEQVLAEGSSAEFKIYKKKDTGLPFSFIVDFTKGDVNILLKKESDLQAGGGYKKVRHSIHVQDAVETKKKESKATLFVQALNKNGQEIDSNEYEYYKKFAGQRGILSVHSMYVYFSEKKLEDRQCIFQDAFDSDFFKYVDNMIMTNTPLDKKAIMQIALDVGHGLRAVHREGIIHHDVKLENILIKKTEKGYVAVLCDFGLAFNKNDILEHRDETYGTPAYSSPEILRPTMFTQFFRQPADMYSLGIALHQTCLGNPKWIDYWQNQKNAMSKSTISQVVKLQKEIAQDLQGLKNIVESGKYTFDEGLIYIIYQLLDPNPKTRMTAEQFVDAMENLQKRFPEYA